MSIVTLLNQLKRKRILKILRNTSSEKFDTIARKKLLKAFRKFCSISPAYMNLLKVNRIDPKDIRSYEDFCSKLPVLNKQNLFVPNTFSSLLGSNTSKVKLTTSSSGFSGTFAYGFASAKSIASGKIGVDTTLDYWFDISNRKTFLINCAPMGVHIETSLTLAETSVRSDMALSLIQKISPGFDQTIIVGDPHFLKKLVEEGIEKKIEWKARGISLITGQDWLPEALRTYLANLTDIDIETDEDRGIYATMGMTELGLNVFHESKYLVRLRRVLQMDTQLRYQLTKSDMKAVPSFFHYYPFRTYVESVSNSEQPELLFSILDNQSLLPMIRYSTGDAGEVIGYNDLSRLLNQKYPHLIPDLKLPVGILHGRLKPQPTLQGAKLYIEDIKEGLYSNFEVARSITGILSLKTKTENSVLLVQLKPEIQKNGNLERIITQAAHTYLTAELKITPLGFYEFPQALEISYERKLSAF